MSVDEAVYTLFPQDGDLEEYAQRSRVDVNKLNDPANKCEVKRASDMSAKVDQILKKISARIFQSDVNVRTSSASIEKNAPTYSCVLNLMNTQLGAGLVAFPYAFAKMGIIMGLVVTLFSALLTMFTLQILSVHVLKQKNSSFSMLASMTMPRFKVIMDFVFALTCFGNAVSYLCIIGDNAPDAISGMFQNTQGFIISRKFWVGVLVMVISFPFSAKKNLHSIRHISLVGILLMVFLTVILCLYAFSSTAYFDVEMQCSGGMWYIGIPPGIYAWDIVREVPIFIFGFGCHQNLLSLCKGARVQTQAEFNRIIVYGVSCTMMIYAFFAVIGFYLMGTEVEADIITCLPANSALVDSCRLVIALKMAFSVPLQLHPSRNGFTSMIYGSDVQAQDLPAWIYFTLTFLLVAASTAIALVVTKVHIVFALVGAVCNLGICYILPGFFFVKLVKRSKAPVRHAVSILIMIIGLLSVPLFVVLQIN